MSAWCRCFSPPRLPCALMRLPHRPAKDCLALVPAESLRAKVLDEVIAFHTELGIPIDCRLIRKDDAWCSLYCLRNSAMPQHFESSLLAIQLYRWFPSVLKVITVIRPETLVRWHFVVTLIQNHFRRSSRTITKAYSRSKPMAGQRTDPWQRYLWRGCVERCAISDLAVHAA